jgi:8-oxo-dGTP pyrophosphatase MutT (NUDIX family)
VIVNQADFPHLFNEHIWPWGPVRTIFEPAEPPVELVSNINIVPFDDTGWLIIRQQIGWGIVGGTLELGETYMDTLKRELLEEAGCELVNFEILGALRMEFLTDQPYRPHLPFPVSYRLLGVGEVRRLTTPTNPEDGEEILEVRAFGLEEACRRLEKRPDDGLLLAEIYRYAAIVREHLCSGRNK